MATRKDPGPSVDILKVDPDLAESWLAKNTRNRNIREPRVTAFARDMAAGKWALTGEAIKFGKSGALLDGQHRLLAVIRSGTTIETLVIRGVEDDAQDVMDTGAARMASDQLRLRGFTNTASLAATAKWAICFDTGRLNIDRVQQKVTHAEVLQYVEDHTEALIQAVEFAASIRRIVDLPPSILSTAILLCSRVDRDEANEFFARLADGVNLPAGSAILALRSRLREVKTKRIRVQGEAFLSVVIRAWNHAREGNSIATIPIFNGGIAIHCPQPK